MAFDFLGTARNSFLFLTKNLKSNDFKKKLGEADINVPVPQYWSQALFGSIIVFIITLAISLFAIIFLRSTQLTYLSLIIAGISSLGSILFCYFYPYYKVMRKINSIKANLALAILSMATVGESGIRPQYMFESIAREEKEYPYISTELSKIPRFMKDLGLSLGEAIETLAKQTISEDIKKFLNELKATIESGGDLTLYMIKRAEQAQFEYRMRIDEANKRAELFGDIYTAVVIAAPLFIFSAIMLIGMFGGIGFQTDISFFMSIGIFVLIPAINIAFLLVMEVMSTR